MTFDSKLNDKLQDMHLKNVKFLIKTGFSRKNNFRNKGFKRKRGLLPEFSKIIR